jgi:hypothetical protein
VPIPETSGVSALAGVSVHRDVLSDGEVVVRRGLPTTSALRTVAGLGRQPSLVEAVVTVDMALREGLIDLAAPASGPCRAAAAAGPGRAARQSRPLPRPARPVLPCPAGAMR